MASTYSSRLLAVTVICSVLGCAHDSASQSGAVARDEAAGTRTSDSARARSTPAFDRIFEDTVAEYRLPGLALGIIADGEVVYQRTVGETVAGSGRPIDGDTLFKIASNSKAMTTGVLARLVDAGRLDWDDPVVRHLPAFRMRDPWVTSEIQVRDLLIHNSGLREGAGDLMFWPEPNSFTRADVIAGLAHLELQYSFRSRYAYDNLLYVVAGEVAAAAGGLSYEELVRREVFAPLGMSRCQAGAFRRDAVGNVAQPHMSKDGQNVPVRVDGEEVTALTSAAAGGIRCSLNDMLKWLKLWLDPGMRIPGSTAPWLTREQREALWTPHMPLRISQRQRDWDGSRFSGYGYGWRVSDVDGVLRVAHTGTLMGMYSAVVLLPEKRAGFVFMINGDGSAARVVLTRLLVQHFTDPGSARSVADYARELARDRDPSGVQPSPSPRQPAAPQSLQPMLGVYRDPWFGEVSLCEVAGAVQFRSLKSPLMAGIVMSVGGRWLVDWIDDSVDAEAWLQIADPPPAFAPAGAGKTPRLTMSKVDPEADFSYDYEDLAFTRIGACGSR